MASSDESLGEIKDNVILNEEEGDRVINKDNGKSFPKEAVDVLKQLYMKGMVGWGKSHSSKILTVTGMTGLTLSQVKVKSEQIN